VVALAHASPPASEETRPEFVVMDLPPSQTRGQAAVFPLAGPRPRPTRASTGPLCSSASATSMLWFVRVGGRLRVIALITDPEVVVAILTSLHLPAAPPPIAKPRSLDYFDPAPDQRDRIAVPPPRQYWQNEPLAPPGRPPLWNSSAAPERSAFDPSILRSSIDA
jgi:hypothetical protein